MESELSGVSSIEVARSASATIPSKEKDSKQKQSAGSPSSPSSPSVDSQFSSSFESSVDSPLSPLTPYSPLTPLSPLCSLELGHGRTRFLELDYSPLNSPLHSASSSFSDHISLDGTDSYDFSWYGILLILYSTILYSFFF